MPNEADFLNDALGQIGATRIVSIDDGTVNANWCKTFYPALRRALLRTHFWNFAEARVQLAQAAVAPAFEFAYAYSLPSDFLRMKEYNGTLVNLSAVDPAYWATLVGRYKIEGAQLLTNDGEVKIVYGRDVDNPALWDPLFYQVCTTWLASKLAVAINKNAGKSAELLRETISILLPFAAAVDGQEGTITPYISDDLVWGR